MDETRKRQELILDHLKLKYVPETETKEPAKLVERKDKPNYLQTWLDDMRRSLVDDIDIKSQPTTKPKKKRDRPKKK